MNKRVVVIGGGVVGITTAAALVQRGFKVVVLERSAQVASGASAGNGGQLSYGYSDALASPATFRALPRLLAGLDPAFRIRAKWDAALLGWLSRFLLNCSSERYIENTHAVLKLAMFSQGCLATLRDRYPNVSFHHTGNGKLLIYEDALKWQAALVVVRRKCQWGMAQQALTPTEAIGIEPSLASTQRKFIGAVYSPTDEAGDSQLFSRSLSKVLARDCGVELRTGTAAGSFEMVGGRIGAVRTNQGLVPGDTFVLATGSNTVDLASQAGIKLSIVPMKGYSVTLPASAGTPSVSITDTTGKIVFCRLGSLVRIAGLAELGASEVSVDPHRIDQLLADARAFLPNAADWSANPNGWAGLRPMTPDSRPIIGATSIENLFLNCGHGMLGWTLACGSAELAAAAIAGEHSPIPNLFDAARFSRGKGLSTKGFSASIA